MDWEDDELSELPLDSLVVPLEESVSLDLRLLPLLLLRPAFFAFLRSLRRLFFSFLCFFIHSSFKEALPWRSILRMTSHIAFARLCSPALSGCRR